MILALTDQKNPCYKWSDGGALKKEAAPFVRHRRLRRDQIPVRCPKCIRGTLEIEPDDESGPGVFDVVCLNCGHWAGETDSAHLMHEGASPGNVAHAENQPFTMLYTDGDSE